ncbi:MAG TPA: Crp/Fnr family transcriptional regulator [Methylomirabilota bacterium]|jgi:CRP/FNR family transcriptional regulator|nr:Crp/Fnr family transcriptional regulator [Methylomirabilota bacterium]
MATRTREEASAPALTALRRVAYFRSVPAAELAPIARRCRVLALGKGERAFEVGEPCPGLFVIISGAVELRQASPRGREQVLHAEGPGAALGEAPLFDGKGFIATAVAPTRLVVVPRTEVLGLCRRHPAVALAMLGSMARRVRRFAVLAEDLALRSVTERLARHLEAAADGEVVNLGLTQEQLASRLGTVRELVSRALAELERGGLIERRRSKIVLRDAERLAALARGESDDVT